MNRIFVRTVACVILLATSLSAQGAQRWAHVREGDVGVSFSAHGGLTLSCRGEALAHKSSIQFHDGKCKNAYFRFPSEGLRVATQSTLGAKMLLASGCRERHAGPRVWR